MSKIIVLILAMCALSLFYIASPCEASPVDGDISVSDEKSPQSDHILDEPKDSALDNNGTSSDMGNSTENGRALFDFPEEGREVIVGDRRCPDGQSYQFGSCREDE
ncbi:uncharacterized protein LOC100678292 [Nasonia vitripennis]|uniref:Uncharacterized protein n=1 Tax=Nasonia vitripennis TaxID=7425 RepID=A0A7M7LKR8_NASVI|nr:uncharacterized protein LOC100678292 [Nasonia vitripennis]